MTEQTKESRVRGAWRRVTKAGLESANERETGETEGQSRIGVKTMHA